MIKRHKYSAKATWVDGIRFASKAEAAFYVEYKLLISELQVKVYLTRARLLYKPDFLMRDGRYVDVKGAPTPVFNIKKRLWKHYGPGVLEIWKLKGKKFYLSETVNGPMDK